MPRRKEPTRDIEITIGQEAMQDALSLWIQRYHGIEVDPRTIEVKTGEGQTFAWAHKKAGLLGKIAKDKVASSEEKNDGRDSRE
jgi:hypothetical protein